MLCGFFAALRLLLYSRAFCTENFFAFAYRQLQKRVFDNDKPESNHSGKKSRSLFLEMSQESSLFQRGTNSGPSMNSAISNQALQAQREQQAYANEYAKQVGASVPMAGTINMPSEGTNLTWNKDNTATITREFHLEWDFSLNEAASNPTAVQWKVEQDDWNIFQKKQNSSKAARSYETNRIGDLDKAIVRKITVVQTSSNFSEPLGVQFNDKNIKGRVYGKRNFRAPYVIGPNQSSPDVSKVIHVIDPEHAKMADKKCTRINEAYLDAQWSELPGNSGYAAVSVDSDITQCIKSNADDLQINLREIPLWVDKSCYMISKKLVDACKNVLLKARQNVTLPYTNLSELSVELVRTNGKSWENTDVMQRVHDETGLVGTELLDKRNLVHCILEVEYSIAAGPGWNVEESQ